MLRVDQLSRLIKREYRIVTDIDHNDVSVIVDCYPIGGHQGAAFHEDGRVAVGSDLIDTLRIAGVGGVDGAVGTDRNAVEEGSADGCQRMGGKGLPAGEVKGADVVNVGSIEYAIADGAAERMVEGQSLAGFAYPFGG